jgi:hypothetical protein
MKLLYILLVGIFCLSFYPSAEKSNNSSNGFYICVEDFLDNTFHKYIVESKDSVNHIFRYFFKSELELGNVQKPISIYDGDFNFYIARVNITVKPNGEKSFKHLKYTKAKVDKRSKPKPVYF